ncbi:octapeptide-repeat protein T2-like, partial [Salvelinus sp. IW2-2015]|uniref:octapeptide-repeat protein T2-like n=1 Tax=Salvelinus sp. IW2-2015 TaxID=2691554 RepID=UPI0038D3CE63
MAEEDRAKQQGREGEGGGVRRGSESERGVGPPRRGEEGHESERARVGRQCQEGGGERKRGDRRAAEGEESDIEGRPPPTRSREEKRIEEPRPHRALQRNSPHKTPREEGTRRQTRSRPREGGTGLAPGRRRRSDLQEPR